MLIPLSWLKEYVDIKMPFPELAAKLSEAGLTVETWKEIDDDIIFDPEITPNRPDWMSVYGIAREISALTNSKLKKEDYFISSLLYKKTPKSSIKPLKITIKPNCDIVPRITSIIIKNVKVKPSPEWLQKRIKQIGLRPINNLVDITNYVLWTYGSLLHVFDYDKIRGHQMIVDQAKGGEDFRSLDGIDYKLPKGAVIIKDVGRVIDLLPLKGGENTAASNSTKNILLHSVVVDPVLTRRTSQALGLRSDSSAIAERGLDPNGTTRSVLHAASLVLELAGGEVASEIIDHKEKEFKSWNVEVSHSRIESVLGIKITPIQIKEIFERLGLNVMLNSFQLPEQMPGTTRTSREIPKQVRDDIYTVTVPTFRNDIHIEEDLIEEVGRIYGYNKFPKTLPNSAVPTAKVAYIHDYDFDYSVKQILKGAGYNEIYTYSLISEDQLAKLSINTEKTLRVDNPISKEYEYLRPNIFGNLLEALKINQPNYSSIKLFEFGKEYKGETCDKAKEEYWIWGLINGDKFYESKGDVTWLLKSLGIDFSMRPSTKDDDPDWFHPGRTATIETHDRQFLGFVGEVHPSVLAKWGINGRVISWKIKYGAFKKIANFEKKFEPISKYPAVIEDVTLIIPRKILYGDVVSTILSASKLVSNVQDLGSHEDSRTLHITYLDPSKNLTDKDVAEIKTRFLRKLKEELGVKEK